MKYVKLENVRVGDVLNCLATDGFAFIGVNGLVKNIHRFGLIVTLWLAEGGAYQGKNDEVVTILKGE